MNILTDCIRADAEYSQLLGAVRENFRSKALPILANGLCEGASDAFCVALLEDASAFSPHCALIICPEEKECLHTVELLERFGHRAAFFPARDLSFYDITASHEYEHERLLVLSGLVSGTYEAVVTTPDAALGYTIPPERLRDAMFTVDFDHEIEPAVLAGRLVELGYVRVEAVEASGQFAVRGGIIDVFPPFGLFTDQEGEEVHGANPLRIELFGDCVDRMGIFDVDSQRIRIPVSRAVLPPARELIYGAEVRGRIERAVRAQYRLCKNEQAKEVLKKEIAVLDDPDGAMELRFADAYMTLIYPEKESLLSYFSEKNLVLVRSTTAVRDRLKASEWRMNESIKELLESGTVAGKYAEYSLPSGTLETFLADRVCVHVDALSSGMSGKRLSGIFGFRTKHMVSYAENFRLLCEDLTGFFADGHRVILIAENHTAGVHLQEMLREENFVAVTEEEAGAYRAKDLEPGVVLICWREYLYGYEMIAPRIAVLSTNPDARTGALRPGGYTARRKKKRQDARSIMSWEELQTGDLVVHEAYGIGRYTGIENVVSLGVSRDYIGIQFDGSDKLFLPVEQMDKVSKYIGPHADDGMLKLSRLGGTEWGKAKQRVKAAVRDMAKELIRLYAGRLRQPGFAFPEDDAMQRDFENAFAYEETQGQLDAIADIKTDMEKPVPMDRLLCGDVGYGKTEVALRAAFKAVLGGKQVAILVPTTLLALQHYQTALSRMRSFAVSVDMISRFRSPKEQTQTLARVARGDVDILIGTHRLLGKDIHFHDLGLLIVDEEQRFGVAQKEKLKQMAKNVDVLTLSATPLPRTLNMAMGGIRDISLLDEAPGNRLPVQTYVLEHDRLVIEDAIRRELRRGGQVFYLYNYVDSIDRVAAQLAKDIPDARITVAHGKMEKEELEEIWERMLSGEIDILVCTTIIETGVDIPNANTLIVENAHKLGLSQLHQIRGRVGRSARRAYAYFTYPPEKSISEIAEKRLEAIREYAEFGAGFRIAMRDMEIRGAGNLLGAEQHGHMDTVGYDLYIRLLNEAVIEEQGGQLPKKRECAVTINVDANIPAQYVRYPAQRMSLYKRIALIRNEFDRQDMTDELLDRFGELPAPTENLLMIALIRALALECGLKQIKQEGNEVRMYPEKFDFPVLSSVAAAFDGRMRVVVMGEPHISLRVRKEDNVLKIVHDVLEKYTQISQDIHKEEM